ncbi:MAG: AAA family ATPase [Pirellulales bacterium]|nr:AAA family ATPase [Pirellulales bacterium]
MKILRLDLRAFGPFTDFELDLSAGNEGLHLIYGPNEAGKSSALRAVEQMLFGIPARSADDFVHSYSNLRVGGTIRGRDDSPLGFLRRKGNKATLLDAAGGTPLDDRLLNSCLGSLDRDLFVTMFGIGHQQLVQGGQEIVRGRGEVGQLLFAAGSGISDLQQVRDSLENRAEELFTRRGQVRQINQKLKALDEARRALRDAQLPAAQWAEHDEALQSARGRRDEVVAELQNMARQKRRLERICQGQPLIARRRNLREERMRLGCVPILPEGFADQRREAETCLRIAYKEEQTASEELARIEQELELLKIPADLLDAADRIEDLPQALGSYRKAQGDLPGLIAHRGQLEAEARLILRQLRPDLDLGSVDPLRLTSQERLQIQNLGNRHEALVRQLEQARAQIDEAQSRLADAEGQLAGLENDRDARLLVAAVRRIRGQGDLEEQRDAVAAELRRAEDQANVDLKRLGLWCGSLDALESLPVPPAEAVDRHEADFTEVEQRVRGLEERVEENTSKQADVDRQIEELRLAGEVPTEDDLLAARRLRDEGWELVVQIWGQGCTEDARLAAFLDHFTPGLDLAAAYSAALERTDELADRLRRESNRVATRAALQANRGILDREAARHREQLLQAEAARQQTWSAWRFCWAPAQIEPFSPREMRAWLRQQQALAARAQGIRSQRFQVEEFSRRIAACCRELSQCLEELHEPVGIPGETLGALLDRCQQAADRIVEVAEKRQMLGKTVSQMRGQVASAKTSSAKAELQLGQWQKQWAAAISPLGLASDSTPAMVNEVVARIGELFDRLKDAGGFAERIEQIGRDGERFCELVRDLARQVAPDLAGSPVERAVEEISLRFRKAGEERQQQRKLVEEQDRYLEQKQAARQRIELLTARLATMCQEAGCRQPEDLPQAERNSEAAGRLDENLASLDDQLSTLAAGAPLDAFVAETEGVDADELPGRIQELSDRIERLEAERDELQRRVGQEENALASMDTGAQASEAAETIQDLLAQITADVDQYVRFRLAAVVLREAVQRYQEENEAPVLHRAGELFRRLTLGSFVRLVADFGEHGEKVLMGDRGNSGNPVPLAGMSDGTCDQLYLALRLASLEHYLQTHDPVPFIIDDILIGFDDGRSAATLEVLAELARKTQVIFFTHHEHLVALAEERVPGGELFVHRLPGRCPQVGEPKS